MVHFLWRSSQPNIRATTYYVACPHFSVHFHTWKQQHIVNGLKLPLNLLTNVRDSNWNVPRFMAFKCKLSAYSKGVFPLGKWNPFVMLYEWGTYTSQLEFCSKKYVKLRKQKLYPIVSRKMNLGYVWGYNCLFQNLIPVIFITRLNQVVSPLLPWKLNQ